MRMAAAVPGISAICASVSTASSATAALLKRSAATRPGSMPTTTGSVAPPVERSPVTVCSTDSVCLSKAVAIETPYAKPNKRGCSCCEPQRTKNPAVVPYVPGYFPFRRGENSGHEG